MAITNHQRVGKALGLPEAGLAPTCSPSSARNSGASLSWNAAGSLHTWAT